MRRALLEQLRKWKSEGGRTALLIDGARRVGKSYLAREFAREYRSHIFIDFGLAPREIRELFENTLHDLDTFFSFLSTYYNVQLFKRESLIIFDEVQLFPKARAALKYLVEDGRFDYLETGSLMSIKRNVQDILIPSEEQHLKMYPMDFEEFLWAMDSDMLMPQIRASYETHMPLHSLLHRKAMELFRQYMIVGGMPQAVDAFVQERDFLQVDTIKRGILELYRQDIAKFARGYESKVSGIFESIPGQLSRHEKKFRLASLKKEARFRDYEEALLWLEDAMVANLCFNSTEPDIGLKLKSDFLTLKCYMADTGLLLSHTFEEKTIMEEGLHPQLLFHDLTINKGMLVENIVAQMLVAAGHKLFFYSRSSREDAAQRMEIDFLIPARTRDGKHAISPIEVKSGKNYTLSSLKKMIARFPKRLGTAYVVHGKEYREDGGITYLPFYMVPCL